MNEVSVRLLRATLQARGPADRSPDCLDAETVAAWADDTLGRDERRAAEAHAADCGRCQALVAAMVQTAPPAAVRSWWRAPVMGWIVPLTAAAAGLRVWMSVPGTSREASSRLVSSAIGQDPPQLSAGAVSNRQDTSLPPPARPDAGAMNSRGDTKGARSKSRSSAAEKGSTEPAALAKALSEAAGVAAPVPSVAPPATAASPPPPQAGADAVAAPVPSVSVQRTAAGRSGSANAASLLLGARRLQTVIVSPNRTSQWRILANGAVQHSTDDGITWEVQATGAPVMLTAGASPAPSICWLVGPQGIVVLSTDGRSWRRVAFPESVDLTSVRATDDRSATINTSDGRAFSTTDGGQTWTR